MVYKSAINIETKGENNIIDITNKVQKVVDSSGIIDGTIMIFCRGSTGALTTIEYEDGLLYDLAFFLEKIAPKNIYYKQNFNS